jgi:hypothetical protein
MKAVMTLFSLFVLAALIGVSVWATDKISIVPVINDLLANAAGTANNPNNPWFVATLFDAYFGFFWFWLWVAYKENHLAKALVWLPFILLLGNMAMAVYVLWQVFKLPKDARFEDLIRRQPVQS